MASQPIKRVVKEVKPILSSSNEEARRRVLKLYKVFFRQIPAIIKTFDLPHSIEQVRQKIRSEFLKHEHVTDPRVIDMLIIKGQMEYQEIMLGFRTRSQVMYSFKETVVPPPKDFLSKFLSGAD